MNEREKQIIGEEFGADVEQQTTLPPLVQEPNLYDGLPIKEVYGSPANLEKVGSPAEHTDVHIRYYFYPTWRSRILQLIGLALTSVFAIYVSEFFPLTVIKGKLFSIGDTVVYLHLPLVVLLPGIVLGKILIYMYDAKYIIDERGVEAQIGLVSLSLRQPRLRYEDIRGVEPIQTLLERLLGIGGVLIGSAMTQDVEIVMEGVANPRGIQLLIGTERDKRLTEMKQTFKVNRTLALTGD